MLEYEIFKLFEKGASRQVHTYVKPTFFSLRMAKFGLLRTKFHASTLMDLLIHLMQRTNTGVW